MKKKDNARRRLAVAAVALFLAFAAVSAKLVWIQIIDASKYKSLAEEQRKLTVQEIPRRGTIYDCNGEVLAISREVSTIYANPFLIEKPGEVAGKLAPLLDLDEDEIEKKISGEAGFTYLARKVDNSVARKIEKLEIEGIGIYQDSKRCYPSKSLASQVIGTVDIDNEGISGLELYYDDTLRGQAGEVVAERDATGRPIPGTTHQIQDCEDGVDIQVTLDKEIQHEVEVLLSEAVEQYGAESGTVVVLDPNNGDVMAMSTQPSYDPNDIEHVKEARMRNRAVTDVYEPGSAMKVITATSLLNEGVTNPSATIYVPSQVNVADSVFKNAHPEGGKTMDFRRVIAESSNVGTIIWTLKMGKERFYQNLLRFGAGEKTGIDFPGEVQGSLPELGKWSGTSIATIAIGQGISVTALHMACMVAAIANGGSKVYPHFLKAKMSEERFEDASLGGLGEEILSDEICAQVTDILENAVISGTGTRAASRLYRFAGKTGTANKPAEGGIGYTDQYIATFVGLAPVDNPRLVCLVMLDEPSPIWGGVTSAPVFGNIMEYSLQHLGVQPNPPPATGSGSNVDGIVRD